MFTDSTAKHIYGVSYFNGLFIITTHFGSRVDVIVVWLCVTSGASARLLLLLLLLLSQFRLSLSHVGERFFYSVFLFDYCVLL